jgi:DNA-binding GntR family transcriptional regulator
MTRELHQLIDSASHSETLTDMIATATAFDQSFRSRFAKQLYANWDTVAGRHEQHREIVASVLAADPDRAERAMRDHILAARQSFRDVVEASVAGQAG